MKLQNAKRCLCSFSRRPKMQKDAFVRLVKNLKSKKNAFFHNHKLAAPAVFRQISNDISLPQAFSGKYQTIFRRSSCFPVNIKRYLAILAVSRQILNDISLPKRFAGRYQMIFIVRTTHSRRMNRRRRAPRDSRENSSYEEPFHFEKEFTL